MSVTRIAIIGCGGMASAHVSRFEGLEDRMKVAAAVDIELDKARKTAAGFPGAKAATDYHEILDSVDAVLLVLPHHLHHRVTLDCLAAGKHVLLEKPMANSEQECLDIIDASDKSDRILMIAYCMRFDSCIARMKELLDARTYGKCFQMSIWTEQLTRFPKDSWGDRAETLGGGQLFSHGCHYIDLLLWFMGNPVSGSHIGTNFGTPWMEKEGTSNVSIRFESGALGYHFGTWGARGTRLHYSFHAHCTEGMLEYRLSGHEFDSERLIFHKGGKEEILMKGEYAKPTRNEMIHFLDCIETGKEPLTNARDSLEGLRLIWSLYKAEEEGKLADLRGIGI
ncbi:MAG: Gfo/Idh/MocA family oxidoreductase [Spirochaetales bacterium]|jgi:predicted dehydrogenase|nr:Gfo/Idh/MocA family oxidoreductase [Spirochaetales bacterium]